MDIFMHRCKKRGPKRESAKEVEVEVVSEGTVDEAAAEEELELTDSEIDCKTMQEELECIKRRILYLQLKLKESDLPDCPEEECVDMEVELNCSQIREICELQKSQYKLQCQLNEVVNVCKFAREEIKDLRVRMCQKTQEIIELQKAVAVLNSWKATLAHEFGVCIERFEYLKNVKAEWTEVEANFNQHIKYFQELDNKFISRNCLQQERKYFFSEVCHLKLLFRQFYDLQMKRFDDLAETVATISQQQQQQQQDQQQQPQQQEQQQPQSPEKKHKPAEQNALSRK